MAGENIEAASWEEAEVIADKLMVQVVGEFICEVDYMDDSEYSLDM